MLYKPLSRCKFWVLQIALACAAVAQPLWPPDPPKAIPANHPVLKHAQAFSSSQMNRYPVVCQSIVLSNGGFEVSYGKTNATGVDRISYYFDVNGKFKKRVRWLH
jgi:hypothetical protein